MERAIECTDISPDKAGEPRPANFLHTNVDQDRKLQLTTTIYITTEVLVYMNISEYQKKLNRSLNLLSSSIMFDRLSQNTLSGEGSENQ